MRRVNILSALAIVGCTAQMVSKPGALTTSPNAPINEAARPGIVKYLNDGIQSVRDSRREDAYRQMREACSGPYKIDAEGPQSDGVTVTTTAASAVFPNGVTTAQSSHYWYIQFSCVRAAVDSTKKPPR